MLIPLKIKSTLGWCHKKSFFGKFFLLVDRQMQAYAIFALLYLGFTSIECKRL